MFLFIFGYILNAMKKIYLIIVLFTAFNFPSFSQNIGIGTNTPHPSAALEIADSSKGFLLPRMNVIERNLIVNPAEGLMIFNMSSGCPNYYFNSSWHEWCGTGVMPLATLSGLNCASASISGSLFMGIPASGVSCTISYTGGNGGVIASQSFASSGVDGLNANFVTDTLANGSGTLTCTITGTPDNSGVAAFQISIGSQTCSLFINVGLPAPFIISSTPSSPGNSLTTVSLFISGPANKTIQVFKNITGTGTPAYTAVTNVNIGGVYYASVPVIVNSNASTNFTAKAIDEFGNTSDLSNSFVYIHDAVAPSAPVITSSSPASPSRTSTLPTITVTGEVGSTIRIYSGGSCTGSILGTGVVSIGGAASIAISVTSNASTILSATATDAAGNVSACSNTFTYIHDNVAPTTPIITSSTPTSPGNSLTPTLSIIGEVGSTLQVYNNSSGTGSPVATTTIPVGGLAIVAVTVSSSTTTTFTAKLIDAAGNVSGLSFGLTYTHSF
jgi:hypothetical protein